MSPRILCREIDFAVGEHQKTSSGQEPGGAEVDAITMVCHNLVVGLYIVDGTVYRKPTAVDTEQSMTSSIPIKYYNAAAITS